MPRVADPPGTPLQGQGLVQFSLYLEPQDLTIRAPVHLWSEQVCSGRYPVLLGCF